MTYVTLYKKQRRKQDDYDHDTALFGLTFNLSKVRSGSIWSHKKSCVKVVRTSLERVIK